MTKDFIVLTNLSKKFTISKSFDINVSFTIPKGSFCGLIGPNGAGKTTIIKSLVGVFSKYNFSGEIKINDHSHYSNEVKNKIGYVPEKIHFNPSDTAFNFIRDLLFIKNGGLKSSRIEAKKIIGTLGLNPKQKICEMSSGEQKKLLITQAFIQKPELLILDEPMVNLDPESRNEMFETLNKMNKEGTTILITSHELIELEKYITDVIIISKGEVLKYGPVSEVVSKKSNKKSLKDVFLNEIARSKDV